ncbi:hypothetical protein BLA18628_07179 [Burkholderia aenigmatica]|nr:hypothetical protein [Burkholderia aenigmatica]VWD60756.1 hypothetical protein BLA18628_07179 [Burkholderia aenigmatica]
MDDFGNQLDEPVQRSDAQCWRVLEFFGLCDADHNMTRLIESAH